MYKSKMIKYFYEGDEWDYIVYYPNQYVASQEIGIKVYNMNMRIAYRRGFLNDDNSDRVSREWFKPIHQKFGEPYRVAKPILEEKDNIRRRTNN